MKFDDVIYGRRSVRNYLPDPVSDADLTYVIDAAIQAPSPMNEEPWVFTVIRNQDQLDRVSRQAKSYLLEHSAVGLRPSHFRNQLGDPNFQIFYHAPALILISAVSENAWSAETCALAAQNLMLAAFARGLGTCWIGFAEHWLQTDDGKTAAHLPHHYRPVAPIIIGHPRATPPPVARRPATVTRAT